MRSVQNIAETVRAEQEALARQEVREVVTGSEGDGVERDDYGRANIEIAALGYVGDVGGALLVGDAEDDTRDILGDAREFIDAAAPDAASRYAIRIWVQVIALAD